MTGGVWEGGRGLAKADGIAVLSIGQLCTRNSMEKQRIG